jgi:hypothetical protein
VSDTSMDSQMASAACPAAPETLLMASSCERNWGTEAVAGRGARVEEAPEYPFESDTRLI